MKNTFFNGEGELNLNEAIYNHPSYIKILEDNIVSKEELLGQFDLVLKLFAKIEEICDETQKALIKDLIIEINILNTISKMYNFNTEE